MKLKLTLLAVAATLALGYQVQASPGTTSYSLKLTVSAVLKTNTPSIWNGNTEKWGNKTVKFGTKDLLDLFALWNGINDRSTNSVWKDAQLVIGYDWSGDVLVVDKTGTNVVFDASDGIYVDDGTNYIYEYFYVDYYDDNNDYASSGIWVNQNPGKYAYTDMTGGYAELYDDYEPAVGDSRYIDIWSYGSSRVDISESWDGSGDPKGWNATEKFQGADDGDQYIDNGAGTVTSFNANASGHGKGNIID